MDDELLKRARSAVSGVFAGSPPDAILSLRVALWHVATWWSGTALQHNRLSEASSPAHAMADVALLVLALRNLLRSAYLAEKVCPDQRIHAAILRFESRLPGLTEIRDVLEHFDEYAVGSGRYQTRATEQPPGAMVPRVAFLPGGFLLKVGPHALGAGATRLASEDLARTVIEALEEALVASEG